MAGLDNPLLRLYLQLTIGITIGVILDRRLPQKTAERLGQGLYWFGVPVSILGFLRQTELSWSIWVAPLTAWVAILLGGGLAVGWWRYLILRQPTQYQATQGSFLLAAMMGNTGYLGYPVTLTLIGPQTFAWAVLYDMAGTTLGAYGLGAALAAYFHNRQPEGHPLHAIWRSLGAIVINPALWGFSLGILTQSIPLPAVIELGLKGLAWGSVALALVLIGMRLGQLRTWGNLWLAAPSLVIKMLVVPLVVGLALSAFGIVGAPRLALVLQMAMPPAFATLVLAEIYSLDRELTVTTLAMGSIGLMFTLPLWLWLFGVPAISPP